MNACQLPVLSDGDVVKQEAASCFMEVAPGTASAAATREAPREAAAAAAATAAAAAAAATAVVVSVIVSGQDRCTNFTTTWLFIDDGHAQE